jgi:hypothetical protein
LKSELTEPLDPLTLARPLTVTPLTVLKVPPTNTLLLLTARARTLLEAPGFHDEMPPVSV